MLATADLQIHADNTDEEHSLLLLALLLGSYSELPHFTIPSQYDVALIIEYSEGSSSFMIPRLHIMHFAQVSTALRFSHR